MKPNIPWFARFRAWWHEAWTGHTVRMQYSKGKYRRLSCEHVTCWKSFHKA
jgi:hypothetical protein